MEKKRYELCCDTPIMLYGAAFMATVVYEKLLREGYTVVGFIDKRAAEIVSFYNLPVYSPDDEVLDKEKAVILVTVKNVFEHSRIAKMLLTKGYAKIIYMPFDTLNSGGSPLEKELCSYYKLIVEGKLQHETILSVPYASAIGSQKSFRKVPEGVIKESDDNVTAFVPITLLFTNKDSGQISYPLLFLKPHIDFVRYVLGMNDGSFQSYLDYCIDAAVNTKQVKITTAWKENVIANRYEVVSQMNHAYNVEPDFFVRNAPLVEWDPDFGRFCLKSGKHRASFMTAVGRNYIPVSMSRGDWDFYCNVMEAEMVLKGFTNDNTVKGLACPVDNPYLYGWSSISENYWFILLGTIMKALRDWYWEDFSQKKRDTLNIYIDLDNSSFFQRFFNRCGWNVNNHERGFDVALLSYSELNDITAVHSLRICDYQPDEYWQSLYLFEKGKEIYVIRE